MAEREDARSDGLITGEPEWTGGGWDADQDLAGHDWPGDDWADQEQVGDDWADDEWAWDETRYDGWYGADVPEPRPWYRRAGFLVTAIIVAMVALVVASVLLLTNARFGEQDEMRLTPTVRTSAVTVPSRTAPERPSVSSTPTTTSPSEPTTTAEEPAAIGEPEPPRPPAAPGPGAIGAQTRPPDEPDGPRTNVTRNPMSFTPGR